MSIPTLYVSKKSTPDPLLDLLSRKKAKGGGKATRKATKAHVDNAGKGKKDEKTTVLDEIPMLNFLSSDVKQEDGFGTPGFGRQRGKPLWSSGRLGGSKGNGGEEGVGLGSGERLFGMKVRGKRGLLKGKRSREEEGKEEEGKEEEGKEVEVAVEKKMATDSVEKKKKRTLIDSVEKNKKNEEVKKKNTKKKKKRKKVDEERRGSKDIKTVGQDEEKAEGSSPDKDVLNLALLAAKAGASAATGKVLGVKETKDDNVTGHKTVEKKQALKVKRKPIMTKDAESKRKKRLYTKRSDLPPLEVNGTTIPRVVGVPDEVLVELASTHPTKRPVRCGYCRSCENPARKKACEVMRSLGANPPIPRGRNRLAILGAENVKKHVSRTCDVPFSNTPLSQSDDGTKKVTPASAEKNASDLAEKMEAATDSWTEEQTQALHQALLDISPNTNNFWLKVSHHVPGRNQAECFAKVYENAPLYNSSNKPKAGRKGSDGSTPLDPNDDEYLAKLIKRRRDRALGTIGKRLLLDSKIVKATTTDGVSGKELLQDILQALKAADDQDDGGNEDSDWSDAG